MKELKLSELALATPLVQRCRAELATCKLTPMRNGGSVVGVGSLRLGRKVPEENTLPAGRELRSEGPVRVAGIEKNTLNPPPVRFLGAGVSLVFGGAGAAEICEPVVTSDPVDVIYLPRRLSSLDQPNKTMRKEGDTINLDDDVPVRTDKASNATDSVPTRLEFPDEFACLFIVIKEISNSLRRYL